jgi:hypothetical protein
MTTRVHLRRPDCAEKRRGIPEVRRGRDAAALRPAAPIRPATPIRPAPPIRPAARLRGRGPAAVSPSNRFDRSPRRMEPADGRRTVLAARLGPADRGGRDAWLIGVPAIRPFPAAPLAGSDWGPGRSWVELERLGGSASRMGLSVDVPWGGMRIVTADGCGPDCGRGISVANTDGASPPGCGCASAGRLPAGGGPSSEGAGLTSAGGGGLWRERGLVRSTGLGVVSAAAEDAFVAGDDFERRLATSGGNPGGRTPGSRGPRPRVAGSPVASAIAASRTASSSGERCGLGELRPRPCRGS